MKRVVGILLLLLTACTGSVPQVVKFDRETLLAQIATLPGVEISADQPLRFSYPEQSMFGTGAVLPLPGGVGLLDPLADFLQRNPALNWRVDVRVQTKYGIDYDQTLAEKRSELLATYLLSKGVTLTDLAFYPEAAVGTPLVFTLNLPAQSIKNGGNE